LSRTCDCPELRGPKSSALEIEPHVPIRLPAPVEPWPSVSVVGRADAALVVNPTEERA
jgi:hypothetical protein